MWDEETEIMTPRFKAARVKTGERMIRMLATCSWFILFDSEESTRPNFALK